MRSRKDQQRIWAQETIIDVLKKRPAKNLDTRDHLSLKIEWNLQTG